MVHSICTRCFPYRLYALSNVGSLIALLTYPLLFEPYLKRREQAAFWSWGCSLIARSAPERAENLEEPRKDRREMLARHPPSNWLPSSPLNGRLRRRLHGYCFEFSAGLYGCCGQPCASALLLATTNKLCLDVAVFPFLWIVPLIVYLFSFMVCFDSPRWYSPGPYLLLLALAMPCFAGPFLTVPHGLIPTGARVLWSSPGQLPGLSWRSVPHPAWPRRY